MIRINLFCLALASTLVGAPSAATPAWSETEVQHEGLAAPTTTDVPEGLAASDWSSIRSIYESSRHAAFEVEDGYQARNPGQSWTTHFDGRGFETKPDAGDWTWGFDLVSYGWGGEQQVMDTPLEVKAEGDRIAYAWDDRLTEWYVNDTRGLEHGYTVHARPEGSDGHLELELAVRGELTATVSADGRDVYFASASGEATLNYAGLTVFDATGEEVSAKFEVVENGLHLKVIDDGAEYPLTIDPVAQQAYIKASNTGAGDMFGHAVAASGDTVVVGAMRESSNATGVNGNQSDNSLPSSGAVYVFVRSGGTWIQEAYLKASNTDRWDTFGYSVAISGDTIIVGTPQESSDATSVNGNQGNNNSAQAGAAYVFVRNGGAWSQEAYLKASNTDAEDRFGTSVAISDDTIVVGALEEDSNASGVNGNQGDNSVPTSGAVYAFVRSGSSWSQEAYIKASNTDLWDYFGASVAISGDMVMVGAPGEGSSALGVNGNQSDNSAPLSGAVYVFVRSGSSWSQEAYIKASNTDIMDTFGSSVALSGNTAVVGAGGEDSSATGVDGDDSDNGTYSSGAVYVFVRGESAWSQEAYLKASYASVGNNFGRSVAISGDTAVIGAYGEDSNATGMNGDQSNNSSTSSGAAYSFGRIGGIWSQGTYIKASNTGTYDYFGYSIAISGETLVVGASGEDSNATGVGGPQGNNSLYAAGALYTFSLPPCVSCIGVAFCFGDGSGTPCPCGNNNDGSNDEAGCANGANAGGASLKATGSPQLGADTVAMIVTGLDPNQPGLFFRADNALGGGGGITFGDGLRCASGNVARLGIVTADAAGVAVSNQPMGTGLAAGDIGLYQYWYRNPAGSPCGAGFNLSNGLELSWTP